MIKLILGVFLSVVTLSAAPAEYVGPWTTAVQFNKTNATVGPNWLSQIFSNIYSINLDGGVTIGSTVTKRELTERFKDIVSVLDFDAVAGDATDDSGSFQLAINFVAANGGGNLFVPEGTFKLTNMITLPSGVFLVGSGKGVTVLDMSTATTTNAFIYAYGSVSSLPSLGANISEGSRLTTFASSPGLAVGDVYMIYDTTDYSFSTAASYFRSGEFMQVSGLNGLTVTNVAIPHASYATGSSRLLSKLNGTTVGIRDMTVRFKPGVLYAGIKVDYGRDCVFENLSLSGSQYTQLDITRSFNTRITGIDTFDAQDPTPGENYGIVIVSSQDYWISKCNALASRHGIAHGTLSATNGIPYRRGMISDSIIDCTTGTMYGLDFHGGGEKVVISNCTMPSGVDIGADLLEFVNCQIDGGSVGGEAVFASGQLLGLNTSFTGCRFTAKQNILAANALFTFGVFDHTVRGGVLKITDCVFDLGNFISTTGSNSLTAAISFEPNLAAATEDVSIVVKSSVFKTSRVGNSAINGVALRPQPTKGIKRADISGNTFLGCSIWVDNNVKNLVVSENKIFQPNDYGIQTRQLATPISQTNQIWYITKNHIHEGRKTGMFLAGDPVYNQLLVVTENTSLNNVQGGTLSDSSLDSSLYIFNFNEVHFRDNIVGDGQATQTQLRAYALNSISYLYQGNNTVVGFNNFGTIANVMNITIDYGEFTQLGNKQVWSSSIPTTGYWSVGDRIHKPTPGAGETLGWVCVGAGTGLSATWVEMIDNSKIGGGSNLGGGAFGIYAGISGTNLTFNTLQSANTNLVITTNANILTFNVAGGGEANTLSSLGSGQSLVSGKVGVDLQVYSLQGNNGISVGTPTANIIPITLTVTNDITVPFGDYVSAITTGTKWYWDATKAMTLKSVRVSLGTSGSTSSTFDIQKNGVTIFSTKPTIDATETSTATALTPNVLSTTAIALNDRITFIIDTAGTGGKAPQATFYFTNP